VDSFDYVSYPVSGRSQVWSEVNTGATTSRRTKQGEDQYGLTGLSGVNADALIRDTTWGGSGFVARQKASRREKNKREETITETNLKDHKKRTNIDRERQKLMVVSSTTSYASTEKTPPRRGGGEGVTDVRLCAAYSCKCCEKVVTRPSTRAAANTSSHFTSHLGSTCNYLFFTTAMLLIDR